jgi:CBS domain-containing protein
LEDRSKGNHEKNNKDQNDPGGFKNMLVKDIMTTEPACCTPETSLESAAKKMVDCDCGEIPVVDNMTSYMPLGVVTDRDIVCRTVAKGLNPLDMTVSDCMSTPLVTVMPDMTLEECFHTLEDNQIRRVPVVDAGGKCVGIVSLADIAKNASRADAGEILQEVSAMSVSASNVG